MNTSALIPLTLVLLTFSPGGVARAGKPAVEALPPPPAGKQWQRVWNDEFEGKTLDPKRWNCPPDARRRDGWWLRSGVELDGQGHLLLKTFRDEQGRLVSGCARTKGLFHHRYGYYTCRVKFQSQPGHWTAFWLMGNTVERIGDEGRDGTEIDIMEKPWLDDRVQHTLHWDGYGKAHQSKGKVSKNPGVMEGFHTFSLWWSPDEYRFYVDGRETWRTAAGGVCKAPLYIKLSDEIGTWGGDIAKAKLPDACQVDYVRVYDLVEEGQEEEELLTSPDGLPAEQPRPAARDSSPL